MKRKLSQRPIIHEISKDKVVITHQLTKMGVNNQWVLNIPIILHENLEVHKPYKITIESL